MKQVYYRCFIDNKIKRGNYEILSQNYNFIYFDVRFYQTYSEANKTPLYKTN
jgi:hypothetical protein